MSNISKAERDQSTKRPLYVSIYEQIYEMIENGTFKSGEQLPGENILSKQLGVSRGTLRQALLILQEDGIIYNSQGKGNFVANNVAKIGPGIERLTCAVNTFNKYEYDDILIEVSHEPPSEVLQKTLNINNSSLITVCHRVYKVKSEQVCYSLACIPYTNVIAANVNLNDTKEVLTFVDELLYQKSATSHTKIKITTAGEVIAGKLDIDEGESLFFLEEVLLMATGEPLGIYKYYFRPEYFDFYVNRRNI
jgi:GntR family transcriptional regulator